MDGYPGIMTDGMAAQAFVFLLAGKIGEKDSTAGDADDALFMRP